MDGDYDDPGPDNTLGPSESLDSDDVRNDDGDVVVDAANVDRVHGPDQRWHGERHRIRPRVRGECRTIRPGRVVRRAVDNQSPCRVPTCALRHRGVVPRPARCVTGPGQQPLGRDRTIPSAVIVHAIDATRKQPTLASTALSIHASVHGGALLTRVNRWLG